MYYYLADYLPCLNNGERVQRRRHRDSVAYFRYSSFRNNYERERSNMHYIKLACIIAHPCTFAQMPVMIPATPPCTTGCV